MTNYPELAAPIEHGEQCDCKALAAAVGMDPRALSYRYCHDGLRKRWRLVCHHGEAAGSAAPPGVGAHWLGVGPVDPIKAILMSNDQRDDT